MCKGTGLEISISLTYVPTVGDFLIDYDCVAFFYRFISWEKAEKRCQQKGKHLISIHSEEHQHHQLATLKAEVGILQYRISRITFIGLYFNAKVTLFYKLGKTQVFE